MKKSKDTRTGGFDSLLSFFGNSVLGIDSKDRPFCLLTLLRGLIYYSTCKLADMKETEIARKEGVDLT